ncbi:hypothetical protein J2128_002380 [Methanomicrobium sp. W14]|uniref:flagellin n=1 Tax=Methanomicrobium sp. W14 TaxID=2817839 RepID=UPI001AE9742A|nr:flagellin [Methanomicrobium sp. W14]MBP2134414.1 hypothetical protein [Methanomicrobium sp. W14]
MKRRQKDEDAVAPVIAGLLVLAIIVTAMSVYFNTYVPSLKAEAEIEHLSDVQSEFLSFSSDLENAVWKKSEGSISRNFELGGGDVFLSSIKSGGILSVENSSELFGFNVTYESPPDSEPVIPQTTHDFNSSLVDFSYTPLSNFWQDQGYKWQYGYVNLTTEYGEETPLQYTDMKKVLDEINESGFFSSFFDLDCQSEQMFDESGTVQPGINCTEVTLNIVSLKQGNDYYTSGNGVAALRLKTSINESRIYNATMVNFTIYDSGVSEINYTVNNSIIKKLSSLSGRGFNNVIVPLPENEGDPLGIEFTYPVDIAIKETDIEISAS